MNNKICKRLAKTQLFTKIFNLLETTEVKNFTKNTDKCAECAVYKYDYKTNEAYNPNDINIGDYIQSLAAKQYLQYDNSVLIR